jgi:hypothetical protein
MSEVKQRGITSTEERASREPKAPASPGPYLFPQTHPRGEERATREGDASRGAGGEREDTA